MHQNYKMKDTAITLAKPWILDISKRFNKQLSQFDGDIKKLKEFYKAFGYDQIPYTGTKRWGVDSSTDSSDINYGDIEIGMEMWWRRYTQNSFRWTLVRVSHKYGGIIFFRTIGLKNNISSYIDTGANDLEWSGNDDSRFSLPSHTFYPIEIIKPRWVDISPWNAPKMLKINNIKK